MRVPPYLRFALWGWLARVVIIAAQFLSIRVLLRHLGTTHYAAFAVLSAAASWGALLDFGLGPSVERAVATARGRGERLQPILGAAGRLVLWAVPLALLLVGLVGPFAQAVLLEPLAEAIPPQPPLLLAVVGSLVALTALGGVGYRVFYATQQAPRHHLYSALAALLSLGGLVVLSLFDRSRALTPALVVATAPAALLALLALRQALRGSWGPRRSDDSAAARDLRTRAARQLLLALLSAAVLQVDYLIMSQTLVPRQIVTYTLLARVFAVIVVFHGVLMGASWSELTAAFARGDRRAADGIVRRCLVGSLGVVAFGTLGVTLGADSIAAFFAADPDIRFSYTLITLFAISLALRVWSDVHTYALLALDRFSVLWWMIPAQAAVSVLGQWTLSRAYGSHGIVAGLALSYLSVAWVTPLAYSRAVRSLEATEHP